MRAAEAVEPGQGGCMLSTYSVASHGYAQIGWRENGHTYMTLAHRAAWVHAFGQIPPGLTIDHACKQRRCVNIDHLRLMTLSANARDNGQDAFQTAIPTGRSCRRGHELVHGEGAKAHCRECEAARKRARRRARTVAL